MTLKTCGRQYCAPVEQVRGQMRPGDYYDVIAANDRPRYGGIEIPELYGVPAGSPESETARPEHIVEMDPSSAGDFRICCKTCGRATGWNRADAPGMPGAGADWVRKQWDKQWPASASG